MTLLSVREKFVKLSGRYDLVTDTSAWGDNGADFYLEAGQRLLDDKFRHFRSEAREFVSVSAGTVYLPLTRCESVSEVYVSDDTNESRVRLEKVGLDELREAYPKAPSDLDRGIPAYYATASLRKVPETFDTSSAITYDVFGTTLVSAGSTYTNDFENLGLVILPPPEYDSTIEVRGRFKSPLLNSGSAVSFWTESYPDMLLYAGLYKLETFYRNSEGAQDWMRAIDVAGVEIEMNWVEDETSHATQLEG